MGKLYLKITKSPTLGNVADAFPYIRQQWGGEGRLTQHHETQAGFELLL